MNLDHLYEEMICYEQGVPSRIQHLAKVHSFAALIGRMEGLDAHTQLILEVTAYVHDIGIKPALEIYGTDAGPYQEKEGIPAARDMLTRLGFASDVIDRVCYIVGHHHTYTHIDGPDYQILVEADFLVNLYENNADEKAIRHAYDAIFRTASGKKLCQSMYAID